MDLEISFFSIGVSTLFPLINPIGTALIVDPYLAPLSLSERKKCALQISMVCLAIGLVTLAVGSWILKAVGISLATTQVGGGLVIAQMGYSLLNSSGSTEARTREGDSIKALLVYPIAFPLTLGPGCLSALIGLSAHAHAGLMKVTLLNHGLLALALLFVLVLTYICLSYSPLITQRIGPSGSQILNKVMSFFVFCVGLQMVFLGLTRSFPSLFR